MPDTPAPYGCQIAAKPCPAPCGNAECATPGPAPVPLEPANTGMLALLNQMDLAYAVSLADMANPQLSIEQRLKQVNAYNITCGNYFGQLSAAFRDLYIESEATIQQLREELQQARAQLAAANKPGN